MIAAIRALIAELTAQQRKFMWTWTVMHHGAEAAEIWRDR